MLELYVREHCGLCDKAAQVLREAGALRWTEIDIGSDPALLARYELRIPVLRDPSSGRELGWPFNAAGVRHWLQR